MSPIVIIIGPPGAGKTTVAGLVGSALSQPVRDSDHDIESRVGKSVAEIFIDDGEEHFRQLEIEAIAAAVTDHDGVLSLGGGAVTSPATRGLLAGHNVVFLDVGLSAAVKRVGMNANRPLLLGNVRSTLKLLLDKRRPQYLEVARHRIDTDQLDAAEVATEVLAFVHSTPGSTTGEEKS